MLLFRGIMAGAYILFGTIVVVRMAAYAAQAGTRIVPGIVLGAAMIALGAHRLWLIRRVRTVR
jgi:formate/nitrite transporter FocA (FNT family)